MENLKLLRADALEIFNAALRAADPRAAVERVLQRRGDHLLLNGQPIFDFTRGRVKVVGAGKAGAPMAQALDDILGLDTQVGAVTVKYGHLAPTRTIELYQAGHPLPDANTLRATQSLVAILQDLTENDLVLCLFSGGGSALMEWLVDGVTLDDLRAFTDALMRCGATIYEINTLRKHISRVKGGQLARLARHAPVVSLILSDVLGSPLDIIASGPTAPDSSTFADCLRIVDRYALRDTFPPSILNHYERGARGELADTPKPNDPLFNRVTNLIIADNQIACDAAAREAGARGYRVEILSTQLQGEARELGRELASRAKVGGGRSCWLGGGEPTVKLRGHGKGGRAQELVLAAALELDGAQEIVILSAGTDGTDGPTDAAGAMADNTTCARARALGLEARAFLNHNDAYPFFAALDDLVITGPTNTNVNDLMLALRAPDP